MTMEIEVKNVSGNYIASVREIDVYPDHPKNVVNVHTLKPGESVCAYVWDTRALEVTEVEEVQFEKAGPDDIPKDETNEARLYREKEIKVEDFAGGFMLADYSGKKAPALFCGKSMLWIDQPIVQDPFTTRDEAVKAGMSQIDERAPA